jgi:hypothetical protein
MRTAVLGALMAVLVGACGSSQPSATPDGPSPGASSAPTNAGSVVVDTFAMSGTGGKQGPTTDLAGDYVLSTKVKGKTGCTWSVGLEGDPPLVDLKTSSGTTHQTTVGVTGLVAASYRIVVKSTKCGVWSVSLKRP